ncbi:MAG: PQQ-dependent sugar dehydrogenase [Gemmatimonadota bacterium]
MFTVPSRAASVAIIPLLLSNGMLTAQKPPARIVAPVQGWTSTPTLEPYDSALASRLSVPQGFHVTVFADHLGSPRMMAVRSDGTVFVTRPDSNDVLALHEERDGRPATVRKVVTNLRHVHGIALHAGRIYLATVKEVYAGDLRTDGSVADLRAIITDLPDGGQHPNRTVAVGPDLMLYITVGSDCNQCIESDEEHATILRARLDGTERGVFARGLRNTLGIDWNPETHELWGMDNGADGKGDAVPPEELNLLQASADYGWPFCYANQKPDVTFSSEPPGSTREEHCARTVAPKLTYQAHSAPIGFVFYRSKQFPGDYRNDAFVTLRGSWNRHMPTGYKVVRIHFENGRPTQFEDFLTGFLTDGGQRYSARPAGIAVAADGSLLVSDDTNGVIYRIGYGMPGAPSAR